MEKPTEKQIDFATQIAETLGIDLPEENTKSAFRDFIDDNIDEFYSVQDEIRYKGNDVFSMRHSYVLGNGFCGDRTLNKNPKT